MSNRKRKLVLVLGSFRMGGAERMMINLANELNNSAEVTMLILTGGEDLKKELDPAVKIISFTHKKTLNAFFHLRKFLIKENLDALICTQIHVNLLCMLVKYFSSFSTKIILREATTPGVHFRLNKGFRIFITHRLMNWLYPKADAVVVNSVASGDDLKENNFVAAERLHLIYNPVVTGNFRIKMNEPGHHDFFGSQPVYISVGRLAEAKNYPLLIRAFAKVLVKMEARLIIIGEGNERKSLEGIISEMKLKSKIDLAGQMQNPYPLMKKADVFVLSSDYEGLPNALIEAMACGTQVVTTNGAGGAAEVVMNGELGLLVPVNDVDALAGAMIFALDKKISQEKLINSTTRFDSVKVASEYLALVEKVCNGNR